MKTNKEQLLPIVREGYEARENGKDRSAVPYWLPWDFNKRSEWLIGWWKKQYQLEVELH